MREIATKGVDPGWRDVAFFVAVVGTALALGGALAHAYELPNKIDLSRDEYFIVQRAYDGWNQLAYVLAIQLAGIVAVTILHRDQPRVVWLGAIALGGWIGAQAIFWVWTFPANQRTENWTARPEDWESLRLQWEYSHLAGAALQLLAMMALVVAMLRRAPEDPA